MSWRPTTNAPCSIGQVPLELLDFVVDPKMQRLDRQSDPRRRAHVRNVLKSDIRLTRRARRKSAPAQADRPENLSPRHRFRQHRKRLLAPGLLQQPFVPLGRQQDARQHRPKLLDQPQRLQPGQLRHVHVQQQQMDLFAAEDMEGFLAVAGQQGAETLGLEHHLQRLAEVRVVVGDQQRGGFCQHGLEGDSPIFVGRKLGTVPSLLQVHISGHLPATAT